MRPPSTIADDDVPSVSVNFGQAAYPVAEGDSVTVTVTPQRRPGADRSPFRIDHDRPRRGVERGLRRCARQRGNRSRAARSSTTFTFSATADDVDDDGESVRLGFDTLSPGVSAGIRDAATVTIADDDDPQVTVSFGAAAYGVAEGGTVSVRVTLSAHPERTVTIALTTTDQDGASSSDYSGVPASLTFEGGEIAKDFTFTATADEVDDDGESVRLGFDTLSPGVSAGIRDAATVTIADDDEPQVTVSFEAAAYSVAEGDKVTVKVALSADPERSVTIHLSVYGREEAAADTEESFTADQLAAFASNADYSGVPANVIFNAGDTEKTFTLTATDDAVDDDGESVTLGFGTLPTGVSAGSTDEAPVSITDDDAVGVTVTPTKLTIGEGGSQTYTVSLNSEPTADVTVTIGGASGDVSTDLTTLTFTPDDSSTLQTVTVRAAEDDDAVSDTPVTLTHTVSGGDYGSVSAEDVTITVVEKDTPTLVVSDAQASEADGTVDFEVTLSTASSNQVTVAYATSDGTATAGSDYSSTNGTLTFPVESSASQTISVPVTDDSVDEAETEAFTLTLSGATNASLAGGAATLTATGTITDDDDPQVTVSFEQSAYRRGRGWDGRGDGDPGQGSGADRQHPTDDDQPGRGVQARTTRACPPRSSFSSGDTEKSITFSATADDVDDDGESVKLAVGTLPTNVSAGSTSETTVAIADDDDPQVTVSFEQSTYSVAEGGTVEVTVTLDKDPERTVSIPLTSTNQGGASSADYSGVPATVSFSSGDTEKSITFSATADDVDDDGESVKLGFGTLPPGVSGRKR